MLTYAFGLASEEYMKIIGACDYTFTLASFQYEYVKLENIHPLYISVSFFSFKQKR